MSYIFSKVTNCGRHENSDGVAAANTKRNGLFSRLARERSGNVAIIFALAVVPLVGLVGGAVEFGQALSSRTKLQKTLDAAVLAAGREFQVTGSQSAAKAKAVTFFNAQISSGASGAITVNTVDLENNTMTLGGQMTSPTPFLSIVGLKNITVRAQSQAMLVVGSNSKVDLEVALMLDIGSSMSGYKITDLKVAAKDLIDIIIWENQSERYAKVALAPFSSHVNVGSRIFRQVTNRDPYGTGDRRTCVKERIGNERYTDAAPDGHYHFIAYGRNSVGAVKRERNYDCKTRTPIVPLTKDKDHLKSVIDSFSPDGSKAGHLGTAWAWYLLSPRWSSIWKQFPTDSIPAAYNNPKVRKIAVLMTDGAFNTSYTGPHSDRQVRWLCEPMKATGIEIYTIGFELTSSTARSTLRDYCATSKSHHYDAYNSDELLQAYREIAMRLAQLRLSK